MRTQLRGIEKMDGVRWEARDLTEDELEYLEGKCGLVRLWGWGAENPIRFEAELHEGRPHEGVGAAFSKPSFGNLAVACGGGALEFDLREIAEMEPISFHLLKSFSSMFRRFFEENAEEVNDLADVVLDGASLPFATIVVGLRAAVLFSQNRAHDAITMAAEFAKRSGAADIRADLAGWDRRDREYHLGEKKLEEFLKAGFSLREIEVAYPKVARSRMPGLRTLNQTLGWVKAGVAPWRARIWRAEEDHARSVWKNEKYSAKLPLFYYFGKAPEGSSEPVDYLAVNYPNFKTWYFSLRPLPDDPGGIPMGGELRIFSHAVLHLGYDADYFRSVFFQLVDVVFSHFARSRNFRLITFSPPDERSASLLAAFVLFLKYLRNKRFETDPEIFAVGDSFGGREFANIDWLPDWLEEKLTQMTGEEWTAEDGSLSLLEEVANEREVNEDDPFSASAYAQFSGNPYFEAFETEREDMDRVNVRRDHLRIRTPRDATPGEAPSPAFPKTSLSVFDVEDEMLIRFGERTTQGLPIAKALELLQAKLKEK